MRRNRIYPSRAVYTFKGQAAKNARIRDGSGVQLPVGEVEPHRFKPKSGYVSPMTCEDIEIAIAEAMDPLGASAGPAVPVPEKGPDHANDPDE